MGSFWVPHYGQNGQNVDPNLQVLEARAAHGACSNGKHSVMGTW